MVSPEIITISIGVGETEIYRKYGATNLSDINWNEVVLDMVDSLTSIEKV